MLQRVPSLWDGLWELWLRPQHSVTAVCRSVAFFSHPVQPKTAFKLIRLIIRSQIQVWCHEFHVSCLVCSFTSTTSIISSFCFCSFRDSWSSLSKTVYMFSHLTYMVVLRLNSLLILLSPENFFPSTVDHQTRSGQVSDLFKFMLILPSSLVVASCAVWWAVSSWPPINLAKHVDSSLSLSDESGCNRTNILLLSFDS